MRRAEDISIRATDYGVAVDRILEDCCRIASVSSKQVAPTLNPEEIAEVRDFTDKLSAFSGLRKEFTEAPRQAEPCLEPREAEQAPRTLQESPIGHERTPSQSQSPSQPTTDSYRSDRDSLSRGR